jgi:phosphoglycolate phosphatase-like HAD superfamily hydrolase
MDYYDQTRLNGFKGFAYLAAGRPDEARSALSDALAALDTDAVKQRAVFLTDLAPPTCMKATTEYGTWADWLGVPRHTFSAMFGAVIARGQDYRRTFQHFRPGFDLAAERLRREQADFPEHFDEHDLYPDARPCLEKLRQLGFLVGIAGDQTTQAERLLRDLNLPADFIGISDGWGV